MAEQNTRNPAHLMRPITLSRLTSSNTINGDLLGNTMYLHISVTLRKLATAAYAHKKADERTVPAKRTVWTDRRNFSDSFVPSGGLEIRRTIAHLLSGDAEGCRTFFCVVRFCLIKGV